MPVKFGEIHLVLPDEEKELFTRIRDLLELSVALEERLLDLLEAQTPEPSQPEAS